MSSNHVEILRQISNLEHFSKKPLHQSSSFSVFHMARGFLGESSLRDLQNFRIGNQMDYPIKAQSKQGLADIHRLSVSYQRPLVWGSRFSGKTICSHHSDFPLAKSLCLSLSTSCQLLVTSLLSATLKKCISRSLCPGALNSCLFELPVQAVGLSVD